MTYEENYFLPPNHSDAKAQRQIHEKIIKAVTKQLGLDHPPHYTFLGLNPSKYVEELEQSKEGKTPKEIKEIDKKIQHVQDVAATNDKLIFDLNGRINRLVVTSGYVPTTGLFGSASYTKWTALLDFSVSDQFIFGRVCKKARHGSGTYCFAPVNFPITELEKVIEERARNEGMDKTLLNIIQTDSLIKLLDDTRHTKECFDQLRTMRQLLEEKQLTGMPLIDNLNQNKTLIKKMESVGHFGAVQQGLSKFVSDADVSTVYMPLKAASLLHLVSFEIFGHKKSLEGLYALVTALRAIEEPD